MAPPYSWVGAIWIVGSACVRITDLQPRCRRSEVPYALPPERFTDPVPLPTNWVYEDKEYIFESKCRLYFIDPLYQKT